METWKPIRDFPSYDISSEGRIVNVRTQRVLKTFINDKGYEQVCLRKNNRRYTVKVHKLMADAFYGTHYGMDVRHKDTDRSNNHIDNLYLSNRKNTVNDAYYNRTKIPPRQTPIRVIETGEIYESIRACARDIGCDPTEICKQLDNRVAHVKGLHFEKLFSLQQRERVFA